MSADFMTMTNDASGSDTHIEYGQRYLQELLDQRAKETPDRVILSFAKTAEIERGFEDLSYGRLAQAVDRCAFWLEKVLPKSTGRSALSPIFSTLPHHDLRGLVLTLAAPKTAHQV